MRERRIKKKRKMRDIAKRMREFEKQKSKQMKVSESETVRLHVYGE